MWKKRPNFVMAEEYQSKKNNLYTTDAIFAKSLRRRTQNFPSVFSAPYKMYHLKINLHKV